MTNNQHSAMEGNSGSEIVKYLGIRNKSCCTLHLSQGIKHMRVNRRGLQATFGSWKQRSTGGCLERKFPSKETRPTIHSTNDQKLCDVNNMGISATLVWHWGCVVCVVGIEKTEGMYHNEGCIIFFLCIQKPDIYLELHNWRLGNTFIWRLPCSEKKNWKTFLKKFSNQTLFHWDLTHTIFHLQSKIHCKKIVRNQFL